MNLLGSTYGSSRFTICGAFPSAAEAPTTQRVAMPSATNEPTQSGARRLGCPAHMQPRKVGGRASPHNWAALLSMRTQTLYTNATGAQPRTCNLAHVGSQAPPTIAAFTSKSYPGVVQIQVGHTHRRTGETSRRKRGQGAKEQVARGGFGRLIDARH
jgi:hypothetical protein